MIRSTSVALGIPACQVRKSRSITSPLSMVARTGGRMALRASIASSSTGHDGVPSFCLPKAVSGVATVWSRSSVKACEPSQNSVAPFSSVKSFRAVFATMTKGHFGCRNRVSLCTGWRRPPVPARALLPVDMIHLGFAPRYLAHVSPAWGTTKAHLRIHHLNHKRVEVYILKQQLRFGEGRCLQNVG